MNGGGSALGARCPAGGENVESTNDLRRRAWLGLIWLAVAMGLLLLIPAGTLRYWHAWAYLGVFLAASFLVTRYLMQKSPALLERRLSAGPTAEKRRSQRIIMLVVTIGYIAMLVVPALDHRFKWSRVPISAVVTGDFMTALGFFIVFLVYKENPFTSATVEVASDQRVISSGPYAIVRHPMYAGGTILFLGMPLALGSYRGFAALVAMVPALMWRLIDEERFLAER